MLRAWLRFVNYLLIISLASMPYASVLASPVEQMPAAPCHEVASNTPHDMGIASAVKIDSQGCDTCTDKCVCYDTAVCNSGPVSPLSAILFESFYLNLKMTNSLAVAHVMIYRGEMVAPAIRPPIV